MGASTKGGGTACDGPAATRADEGETLVVVRDRVVTEAGSGPEIHLLASDAHRYLVRVPVPRGPRAALPEAPGYGRRELQHPAPDRLVRDVEASFGQQVPGVAVAQLTHSPLERRISERGVSVEVPIYRGEDGAGWIFEVVDHTGGATVWDEASASDRAALDEALRTIEREGISCFAEDTPQPLH